MEDFVQQAVRAVQAERARIRIGDSTEGRDGLEPVSRQIGTGPGRKSKWGGPRRSPAVEESGEPQWERSERRHQPAGEVHKLRRMGHTYKEAPSPPWPTPHEEKGEPREYVQQYTWF